MDDFLRENAPWVYAGALSIWASITQYALHLKNGGKFSWADLCIDTVLCTFSGGIAFFVCKRFEMSGWDLAIIVSLCAHQGPRAIALLTQVYRTKTGL